MIIQPGPVVDFLTSNHNVTDPWCTCTCPCNVYVYVSFAFQLCFLVYVSLQRYTKSLSTLQRASLVEKSRQKPNERMKVLSDVGVFGELWKVFIVFIVF
jgi:hypothetical protein